MNEVVGWDDRDRALECALRRASETNMVWVLFELSGVWYTEKYPIRSVVSTHERVRWILPKGEVLKLS